jgi:hypothetical protein
MRAIGFVRCVIVAPRTDMVVLERECGPFFTKPGFDFYAFDQAPQPLGHLHHQVIKCSADEYDSDAQWFLYVDSDCLFTETFSPSDYFVDSKPVLLVESYASLLARNDSATVWHAGTEKALGWAITHETMRRHPAVHHRRMLREMRTHISELHQVSFAEYVLSQSPTFPWGFSEFNVLGSFALERWSKAYEIIDVGEHPDRRPKDKLIQYWSHGRLPIEEIERILS